MAEACLSDLIRHYELTDESKVISYAHLEEISRCCCEEWKSLPPYLGLGAIVASDIDKKQVEEHQKRHKLLLKWRKMKGSDATYEKLINALLMTKQVEDAEKVCEILKQSQATETQAFETAHGSSSSSFSSPDGAGIQPQPV